MEIEEFTTEEVTADCGEVANMEEVRGLVEQLGLGGQQKFFATDKVATTFPYRKMTEQERVVYESLCPQRTDLAGYGDGRSEEHTSELQSQFQLVCRLLLRK